MDMLGTVHKWKPNVTDMIWRCLGTAIAMPNTMETRAQEPWSDYSWFFTDRASKSNQQNILKKKNKGWSRTRSERGPNEVQNEVKNYPGQTLTQILELEDFRLQLTVAVEYAHPKIKKTNTELSKERVEYAHPKTKQKKYRSNPNGDKMIPWKISVYVVYTTLSCLNPGQCW